MELGYDNGAILLLKCIIDCCNEPEKEENYQCMAYQADNDRFEGNINKRLNIFKFWHHVNGANELQCLIRKKFEYEGKYGIN